MLKLILIVAVAFFNCGEAQTVTKCSELAKLPAPELTPFIESSPFNYVFATPSYDCGVKVFTNAPQGDTSFDLYLLLIKGTTISSYKTTLSANRTELNGVDCNSGTTVTWYISQLYTNPSGLGYCCYSCKDEAIDNFGCATNNIKLFTNEMKQYVSEIQGVKGASAIKESSEKPCFGNDNCPVFY
ncbi:hypothetical protein CHUAL_005127 [Chamberlinius hualienensis]